jgi:hypothetical protein
VFENRVLRRIFGPKMEEVAVDWRRMHNEELNNLYASSNTIRMIKSRRTRAVHVARMGKMIMCTKFWSQHLKGRDHLEDSGVDGKIILKWILG